MTLDEIYSELAAHKIKGMMIHENLANYYDFLGLKGYKRCHEYHFLDETKSFRELNRYFINHHNKLIPEKDIDTPEIIPSSWYKATRMEVDNNTKRNAIKNGMAIWHNWEKETKKLYEQMCKELLDIDEVASAMFIKRSICDVDKELKTVERYMLNKSAVDYDLMVIIPEQHEMHEKYKCKMEKIYEHR